MMNENAMSNIFDQPLRKVYKVIVVGEKGTGKSTFINNIHKYDPIKEVK